MDGVCKLSNATCLVTDLKSLFFFGKTKRKMVFAYGFIFFFIACTAFLVFNSSGDTSIWFANFFTSNSTETDSSSRSFLYYILPDPNNPSAYVKLHDSFNFSRSSDRSPDLANGTVSGDISGNVTKSLTQNGKVSTEISTDNGTDSTVIGNKPGKSSEVSIEISSNTKKMRIGSGISSVVIGKNSARNSEFFTEISGNATVVVRRNSTKSVVVRKSPARSGEVSCEISSNATKTRTENGTDFIVFKSNPTRNSEVLARNQSDAAQKVGGNDKNKVLNLTSVLRKNETILEEKLASLDQKENKVSGFCDIFDGKWVRDETYPLYPQGSCPHIDEPFDCFLNHRPDNDYQKYRWQPNGCNIPRLNATNILERLRGKRVVFVGDSLNRNMWESLVCILRNSIRDKEKVFEASGKRQFRTEGFYSFIFKDYNCSVEFFRAPFLVQEWEIPSTNGTARETLRLDIIEESSFKFKDADILVFNTGHWWTHEKTSKGKDYYQEGDHIYSELNALEAFRKALRTWAKWVDSNINPKKTHVFFRGYSASHFRGGQWSSGGLCHTETEPITNDAFLEPYPPKMKVLESVISEMKTPISYLNITRMTDYRKDAHPSIYRKQSLTEEERLSSERFQDCSHWCLPGLPDTWNELLYAKLLMPKQ